MHPCANDHNACLRLAFTLWREPACLTSHPTHSPPAVGTPLERELAALLGDDLVCAARKAIEQGDFEEALTLVGTVPFAGGDLCFCSGGSRQDGASLGMSPLEAQAVGRVVAVVHAHVGTVQAAAQLPRCAMTLQANRQNRTTIAPGTMVKFEGELRRYELGGCAGEKVAVARVAASTACFAAC